MNIVNGSMCNFLHHYIVFMMIWTLFNLLVCPVKGYNLSNERAIEKMLSASLMFKIWITSFFTNKDIWLILHILALRMDVKLESTSCTSTSCINMKLICT